MSALFFFLTFKTFYMHNDIYNTLKNRTKGILYVIFLYSSTMHKFKQLVQVGVTPLRPLMSDRRYTTAAFLHFMYCLVSHHSLSSTVRGNALHSSWPQSDFMARKRLSAATEGMTSVPSFLEWRSFGFIHWTHWHHRDLMRALTFVPLSNNYAVRESSARP